MEKCFSFENIRNNKNNNNNNNNNKDSKNNKKLRACEKNPISINGKKKTNNACESKKMCNQTITKLLSTQIS